MDLLKKINNWVLFRTAKDEKGKTLSKAPVNPKDYSPAKVNDPSTWTSYEEAKTKCIEGYGMGFVFSKGCGIVGIDLDHVIAADGSIEPWAEEIVDDIESYTEVSPSGTGLHAYCIGDLESTGLTGRKFGRIELYDDKRFFTVTEDMLVGSTVEVVEAQDALNQLCDRLKQDIPIDPGVLLTRILAVQPDKKTQDLVHGDWKDYYPSQSEADLVLCGTIAYYADYDREMTDSVFRLTGLYRDKWDESRSSNGETYGEMTINKVVEAEVQSQAWPEIIPFASPSVPEFPVECLPEPYCEFCGQVAQSTQTPVDLAASMVLALLAYPTSVGVKIAGKQDWMEPTNLYVCTAMPPASKKSPVLSLVLKPLHIYEEAMMESMKEVIADAEKQKTLKKIMMDKAAKILNSANTEVATSAAFETFKIAQQEFEAIEVPTSPRFIADDVTPEQMAALMKEHNNGKFSLFSAEASDAVAIAGGSRYSSSGSANLGVYLKAHCGDPITVDRVGRPAIYISDPALTMGLLAQPEVIEKMKNNSDFTDLGMIQRMFIALPVSNFEDQDINDFSVQEEVLTRYNDRMLKHIRDGFNRTEDKTMLILSPQAADRFLEQRRETKALIRKYSSNSLVCGWLGKQDGAILRIAAVLHVAMKQKLPVLFDLVDVATLEKAIMIGAYYFAHLLKVADLLQTDPDTKNARKIIEWIEKKHKTEFTRRECHNALQSHFPRAEYLSGPLSVLADRGYIRPVFEGRNRSAEKLAGRPSIGYEVNPALIA